jgi:hypothetical protein
MGFVPGFHFFQQGNPGLGFASQPDARGVRSEWRKHKECSLRTPCRTALLASVDSKNRPLLLEHKQRRQQGWRDEGPPPERPRQRGEHDGDVSRMTIAL